MLEKVYSGRSSTSSTNENIDKMKKIVADNRHSSLREIARDLNIINSDLTFMEHITTGDETWVYEFDRQTGQ